MTRHPETKYRPAPVVTLPDRTWPGRVIDRAPLWCSSDLRDWKDALIESYSHGMRQKLLISSALVHHPEVIVVDEPMVGLDPRSARILKDLLRNFVDSGGTVFLTTHTLEVAEAVCDRIGIMSGGKIVALGTMDDLRAQAHAGGAHLEEIFLKVTHGEDMVDVVAALRAELSP